MIPPSSGPLSRRRFLTVAGGAAAGALLLGACGDDGGSVSSEGGDDDGTTTTAVGGEVALAHVFGGPMLAAGAPVRAPFGASHTAGQLPPAATPGHLPHQSLAPSAAATNTHKV